jgi:hypothetical protein
MKYPPTKGIRGGEYGEGSAQKEIVELPHFQVRSTNSFTLKKRAYSVQSTAYKPENR